MAQSFTFASFFFLLLQQAFAIIPFGPLRPIYLPITPPIDPIFPPNNLFHIQDPVLTKNVNLTINFPSRDTFLSTASLNDRAHTILEQTLPQTLQQFDVPADQLEGRVSTGIPLLIDNIQQLFGETPVGLLKRGIFGDILDWAKDAGCSIVAAAGLPLFLLAAADFDVANDEQYPITADQDFFLTPTHGNLAHDGPVTVYYRATRAPFFGAQGAATYNRNIYMIYDPDTTFTPENHAYFARVIQTLIHEFTHVEQYRADGYDIATYGYSYLFQWCSHGGYSASPLEADAIAKQTQMDDILLFGAPGNDFFQVWKNQYLQPIIGFPLDKDFTTVDDTIRELPFQRGLLQIKDRACYRTFTIDEAANRPKSVCNPNYPCYDKRSTSARPRRRSPLPPENPPEGGDGPRVPCSKDEKDARDKACRDAQAEWKALENRPWNCDVTIAKPEPVQEPPAPKPGCPPNCDLITIVPLTSKSCQFDNPPKGCDHEAAEANNKECNRLRAACAAP